MVQTPDSKWGRVLRYNVHRYLEARGLEPSDVYEHLGMGRRVYSALFKSRTGPRIETLEKLARALGAPVMELLRPVPEEEVVNE